MDRVHASALILLLLFSAFPWGLASLVGSPLAQSKPSNSNFELIYDTTTYEFLYPLENRMTRNVTVKNIERYAELEFSATVFGPAGFRKDGRELGITPLPSPNFLYLQQDESQMIYVIVEWFDIDRSGWRQGSSYDYQIEVKVYPKGDPSIADVAKLTNTVNVLATDPSSIQNIPANSHVFGYVYDKSTSRPLPNAEVELLGGLIYRAQTDHTGFFDVSVRAHKRAVSGAYIEYNARVRVPGYEESNRVVVPREGDRIRLDIHLVKASEEASYIVEAKYKLSNLNLYRGDASKDGRYFALVPFHSIGVSQEYIVENAYLQFFNANGTLLWKYKLYCETPAVDVSDDGRHVATTVKWWRTPGRPAVSPPIQPGVYLLDDKGSLLWSFYDEKAGDFMEVRISHNNRYIAAGDGDGHAYLLDPSAKKILWERFLGGMVRYIVFEKDDSTVYMSSGDGYLYAFKIDGSLLWRTYVNAWAHAMAVSEKYVFVSGKAGYYVYLLDKTGRVIWRYPVDGRADTVEISPDESYMVYHTTITPLGTATFDRNGTLLFFSERSRGGAITKDAKYVLTTGLAPQDRIFVRLVNKRGHVIWSTTLDFTQQHPVGEGYAWISDDGTSIVVAGSEYVYFLRGTISTREAVTTTVMSASETMTTPIVTTTTPVTLPPAGPPAPSLIGATLRAIPFIIIAASVIIAAVFLRRRRKQLVKS